MMLSTVDEKAWNALVKELPQGNLFQTVEWAEVFRARNTTPVFLTPEHGKGALLAARRRDSFPASIFTNVLHVNGMCFENEEAAESLLGKVADFCRREKVVQCDWNAQSALPEPAIFQSSGWQFQKCATNVLKLDDSIEAIFSGLNQKHRNAVRKAEKSSLNLCFASTGEEMAQFYALYRQTMSRTASRGYSGMAVGVQFFEAIFRVLFPRKMGTLLLAEKDGKLVSGVLVLCFKDTAYYYANASSAEGLKYAPNNLLVWEALKWAHRNGYKRFDFCGIVLNAREGQPQYGINKFKEGWGGDLALGHKGYRVFRPFNSMVTNRVLVPAYKYILGRF